MHRVLVCLAGLLIAATAVAQPQTNSMIDSLEQILPQKKGKDRIFVLNKLCWEYKFIDTDKAFTYGRESRKLAIHLKDSAGLGQAYNDMGYIWQVQSEYDSALAYYANSIAIRKALHDSSGVGSGLAKVGMVYEGRTQYPEALSAWLEALSIFEGMGKEMHVSMMANNIAVIHQSQGAYAKALEYYQRSIEIKEKYRQWHEVAGTYVNMASTYKLSGDTAKAIALYEKAIVMADSTGATSYLGDGHNNLGGLLLDQRKYAEALKHFQVTLAIRESATDRKKLASVYSNIGAAKMGLKDYAAAKSYMTKALNISREIGAGAEIQSSLKGLAELSAHTGQYLDAYNYMAQFAQLRDSLLSVETTMQLNELQTRFETEQKEKKILQLDGALAEQRVIELEQQAEIRAKNLWLAGLGVGLLLLGGTGLFVMLQLISRQKRLKAEAETLQREMELRAILSGEEKERKRLALELHDGLGQMLSTIKLNVSGCKHQLTQPQGHPEEAINTSLVLIDDAVGELRNISHNLMPSALLQLGLVPALQEFIEKINGAGQLQVHFQTFGIESRHNDTTEIAMYRILQELLNNVIKYAHATNVTLQIVEENGMLNVMLEDDGQGFDTSQIHQSTGIGWKNIFSRVRFLSGSIDVDSRPGHGTTVMIDLPARYASEAA